MSFRISCRTQQTVPCFEVSGEAANHLDSIVRYVKAKALGRQGFVLDIRAVTKRPPAGSLFIHVLKYTPGFSRKIALVDVEENSAFCSLYERLVRTRGYRVRIFDNVQMANEWLLRDDAPCKTRGARLDFVQGLRFLRHSLNPMRLLHAATSSR